MSLSTEIVLSCRYIERRHKASLRSASLKSKNSVSFPSSSGLELEDHEDVSFSELEKFVMELEPLNVKCYTCNCVSVHAQRTAPRRLKGRPFVPCLQGPRPTQLSVTVAMLIED